MSENAINDKLQGNVATCLRYGGVVNQIKKGLLLSLSIFLNWQIFGEVTSKNVGVVHFLRSSAVWWPGAQFARNNHVLTCSFAKYSPIPKKILPADSVINISYFSY